VILPPEYLPNLQWFLAQALSELDMVSFHLIQNPDVFLKPLMGFSFMNVSSKLLALPVSCGQEFHKMTKHGVKKDCSFLV